jgi:chromosome segregation ATPase
MLDPKQVREMNQMKHRIG